MKKLVFFVIALFVAFNIFANGLSLNSIGPKALGMGGAFIGLADDATAIYWNPAGLSGQENGISISVADIIPLASYEYAVPAMGIDIDAEAEMNHYLSPNFFFNYNMDRLSLGLGFYVPAGLGAEWLGEDLINFNGPPIIPTPFGNVENPYAAVEFEWMSKLGVIDISPAISYQVNDKLSLGLAANIYYGMLEMKRGTDMMTLFDPTNFGTPSSGADGMLDTQSEVNVTGLGYGGAFGLMYKANDNVNVGLSVRTPVNIEFSGDGDLALQGLDTFDVELDLEYPTWVGAGVALMPTDKITLTADAQYSNWSSLDKVKVLMKMPVAYGGETEDEMVLEWENKTQLRLGMEYQVKPCLALRGGFYTDPAPAPDETLTILFPSGDYSVITGGFGYAKNKLSVDFGAEYLFGIDRNVAGEVHNMPGKHGIDIMAFSLGVGYKL